MWQDPGLDGDLYADQPHLYGNALSSFNILRVGESLKEGQELERSASQGDNVTEEGGDGEGLEVRKQNEVPEQAGKRKSWFLNRGRVETWEWQKGRRYELDFFNPYLDFNGWFLTRPRSSAWSHLCRLLSEASWVLDICPWLSGRRGLPEV